MTDDEKALRQLLDALPIYAIRIGYRYDSTPEERAFGEAMLEIGRRWKELKPGLGGTS
jgi:hypothetical protein